MRLIKLAIIVTAVIAIVANILSYNPYDHMDAIFIDVTELAFKQLSVPRLVEYKDIFDNTYYSMVVLEDGEYRGLIELYGMVNGVETKHYYARVHELLWICKDQAKVLHWLDQNVQLNEIIISKWIV